MRSERVISEFHPMLLLPFVGGGVEIKEALLTAIVCQVVGLAETFHQFNKQTKL